MNNRISDSMGYNYIIEFSKPLPEIIYVCTCDDDVSFKLKVDMSSSKTLTPMKY